MLTAIAGVVFALWLIIESAWIDNQFNQIKKDLDYIKDKLDEQA